MERFYKQYKISTDKSLVLPESVQKLLNQSYWAKERPLEVIERSIENSICFGIYNGNEQVGFARVVTDYATIFWIADVIIDERHRSQGLGKELVRNILETEAVQGLLGILMTNDAHGLYQQFGFITVPDKAMVRRR